MPKRLSPDHELDGLIRKLNAAAKSAPPAPPGPAPLEEDPEHGRPPRERRWRLPDPAEDGAGWLRQLLAQARVRHASDLLLVAGAPAMVRVNGQLEPLGEGALTGGATSLLAAALVPPSRRASIGETGTVDFALTHERSGRLRCNVHRERGQWAVAIRLLPDSISDLEALNLPASLARFAELDYGMVLVTGPTGCGKTTTLAAIVQRIMARRKLHLITIEDPVEYEHERGASVVEHVEIGRDSPSFALALRSALRQNPDVLLIGEMRDPESIAIAITAAETGHLVLATLHTGDAPQTINRILDSYPARQIETVRVQLSISLAGIVSQTLLPRADGEGRVPAAEILIATPAVQNLIRQGKIAQVRSQIVLEASAGMLSLDRSLVRLVQAGLVSPAVARARARLPAEFDDALRRSGPA